MASYNILSNIITAVYESIVRFCFKHLLKCECLSIRMYLKIVQDMHSIHSLFQCER